MLLYPEVVVIGFYNLIIIKNRLAMRIKARKNLHLHCSQLTDLKSKLDAAIRNGGSFSDVKKIYMRIKTLKQYLNSMNVE